MGGCCWVFFFLQRKHTHNVASQYLLPCHDVSLPSCRAHRAAERHAERKIKVGVGRKYDDTKKDLNEGEGLELSELSAP